MKIPLPPSANKKKAPYSLDVEIPPGEYYRVEIVVRRLYGDVDNRIKPVMNALARRGLKLRRVIKITCRFGDETTVKVIPARFK